MKVFGPAGSGSTVIPGISWITDNDGGRGGRAIISMSLGSQGRSMLLNDHIKRAVHVGIVVVVSGGNKNADACNYSPAWVPTAITVGSTTSSDSRSGFSNFGTCVDIWAPGTDILSASQTSNTDYTLLSGTSMACPHVAGAAALLREEMPKADPGNILDALMKQSVRGEITGLKREDTHAAIRAQPFCHRR